jgi:ubiquinone/menaquinone biosynthesis C-methylase UbiE
MHHVVQWVRYLAAFLLVIWILGQVRKPTGPLGRRLLQAMNLSHSSLAEWGLEHLQIARNATLLDIGCGGGRTVQRLATLAPEGTVHGVDISEAGVAVSRQTNAREIERKRVQIDLGSVAALPFPDRTFDVVTAVETHYYWPDLPANLREVLRVLAPGGTFAVIAELHRGGRFPAFYRVVMWLIRAAYLTDSEHRDLLTQAGFTNVETFHARGKLWICAIGRRAP